MTEEGSTSVTLPNSFVKVIDEVVGDKSFGYSSRAEFVRDAIRIRLRDLGKNI